MKLRLAKKRNAGMTLFEVGVVVAIVLILAAVFLPELGLNHGMSRAPGITCANNLKQASLAAKIWEGDNGDVFPMGVSMTNGGSMEMVQTGNVIRTFMVMSNELSTPKILLCPADTGKFWTNNFGGLSNSNISYFVGADVTNDADPQMMVGDCNFEIHGMAVKSGLSSFWTNDPIAWQATRHIKVGHLGLADGSVQSATSAGLRVYFQQTSFATNRFAIP